MKITKSRLKEIILEELTALDEQEPTAKLSTSDARAAALAVEAVTDLTGIDIPLSSLLEDARKIEDSVREVFENSQTMLPAPDDEIDPSFG